MRMIGQTAEIRAGRIGRFESPTTGAPVRRHAIALLAIITTTAALLAACSSASESPAEQPAPAAPASTAPATPSTAPASPTPSTLAKWVNVPCSPEGSTARTTSGGPLVCKKVGSDKQPVWHAATP